MEVPSEKLLPPFPLSPHIRHLPSQAQNWNARRLQEWVPDWSRAETLAFLSESKFSTCWPRGNRCLPAGCGWGKSRETENSSTGGSVCAYISAGVDCTRQFFNALSHALLCSHCWECCSSKEDPPQPHCTVKGPAEAYTIFLWHDILDNPTQ